MQLDSMSTLILSMCEELKDHWINIFQQKYGSHVFRTLLNVLSGETLIKDESMIRSKKSVKFLARKAPETVPSYYQKKVDISLSSVPAVYPLSK